MLKDNVRPSTLTGVKRLANQIKKDDGIGHAHALDLAAQAANCANYRHAKRVLPLHSKSKAHCEVFLTTYWCDLANGSRGRETLRILLSVPILDICSKSEFKVVRGLAQMRMVAADHFVNDTLVGAQVSARNQLCKAVASLRFMEYTGLRPFRGSWTGNRGKPPKAMLPGSDHTTEWIDPTCGQFVLVDEPYNVSQYELERQKWAVQHGWLLKKVKWPGMYYPYSCDPYVATFDCGEFNFSKLLEKVESIPAPITEEKWVGESVPTHELFVSPEAKSQKDRRRARSKGLVVRRQSSKTIPFNSELGSLGRRPAGHMSIEKHIESGLNIKIVMRAKKCPYTVGRRLLSLRHNLENWFTCEVGYKKIDKLSLHNVYYGDDEAINESMNNSYSIADLVQKLEDLKKNLISSYPDCAPLRREMHRLQMSISILQRSSG